MYSFFLFPFFSSFLFFYFKVTLHKIVLAGYFTTLTCFNIHTYVQWVSTCVHCFWGFIFYIFSLLLSFQFYFGVQHFQVRFLSRSFVQTSDGKNIRHCATSSSSSSSAPPPPGLLSLFILSQQTVTWSWPGGEDCHKQYCLLTTLSITV